MDIKKLMSLAIEAIVVGFILVVVGTLVSYMVGKYFLNYSFYRNFENK